MADERFYTDVDNEINEGIVAEDYDEDALMLLMMNWMTVLHCSMRPMMVWILIMILLKRMMVLLLVVI